MTRILRRKVRRDLWRHRWQFLAATVVLGIGVAVFVGATDAYADLRQSLDRTYAEQLLPDVVISGPGVVGLYEAARSLPGEPTVELRQQADVPVRVNGRSLIGRVVEVPVATQPAVSKLALQSGDLPTIGSLMTEEHLTEYYGLRPGSTVELLGPSGWRPVGVSGSALSTEYLWPARSRAETLTTPEFFGVVFVPAPDIAQLAAQPTDQLLAHARDRDQARALVTAATELGRSHGLVVVSRDELPSYRVLRETVEAVRTFARLMPWVFLVAAVVGTYVLLSRLVTAQRNGDRNAVSQRIVRSNDSYPLSDVRCGGRACGGHLGAVRRPYSRWLVHQPICPGAGTAAAGDVAASQQPNHRRRRRHGGSRACGLGPGAHCIANQPRRSDAKFAAQRTGRGQRRRTTAATAAADANPLANDGARPHP